MKVIKNSLGKNEYNYSNEFESMRQYFVNSLHIMKQIVDELEYTDEIHNRLQSCSPKMVLVDMFHSISSSHDISIDKQSYFDDCCDYVMNSNEDCFI
jgi:aminopeptidase-like protein